MDPIFEQIAKESRRVEEDALHSAKSHFAAAERWGGVHLWVGIPTTVLAAVAGVSALGDKPIIGGVLAILVASLSALSTFLNPNSRQNAHLAAGNQYQALRNNARIFRNIDIEVRTDVKELRDALLALALRRDELNMGSPSISRWAFDRARVGITSGEADYAVDKSQSQ